MYILFECAAGYFLLQIKEWNDICQNLQGSQQAYLDYAKFSDIVDVKAVHLFSNAEVALHSCQSISASTSDECLRSFLRLNLPSDQSKYELGVLDPALGKNLAQHHFPVIYDKNILEITRLCRLHFKKLVREFKDQDLVRFQVGLSHNYLRTKLKEDVNRQDKPVQNAIAIIENMDKALNTFAMRAKEWYSWHFPELGKIVTDNIKFAQVANFFGIRDNFTDDQIPELAKILDHDQNLVSEILAAKNISMGQDITDADMTYIRNFTTQVIKLADERKALSQYLGIKLTKVVPNLQSLLGDMLAAKLIAHSGSLTNLAKYPASTIQILGAEKALFRALKTKSNTPKYGLLFQSTFVGRVSAQNKGRISRYLANKCSLAARIDNFAPLPCNVFGEKMKEQVEGRMKFFAEGLVPKKNMDAMQEAYKLVKQVKKQEKSKDRKKRKHVNSNEKFLSESVHKKKLKSKNQEKNLKAELSL